MGQNESLQCLSEAEKQGIEFLRVDFSECFQQMRHYEVTLIDICKFAFLGYSSISAAALGLYKFGIEKNTDLRSFASIILLVGLPIGLLLFLIAVRNRVYFVRVTRYINEIRGVFIENKPMGFENKSQNYIDYDKPDKPAFFNPYSSQIMLCHIIAFLNSVLLGIFMFMYIGKINLTLICICVFFCGIQVIGEIIFLKSHDKKSVDRSVHFKKMDGDRK